MFSPLFIFPSTLLFPFCFTIVFKLYRANKQRKLITCVETCLRTDKRNENTLVLPYSRGQLFTVFKQIFMILGKRLSVGRAVVRRMRDLSQAEEMFTGKPREIRGKFF